MSDERDAPRASGDRADELVFAVPVAGSTTVVRRGGGPRARLLVVAVVVLLAAAVGVLVTRGDGEVSAEAALEAAKAAVQGDDPYHLEVTFTARSDEAESDEPAESGMHTQADVVAPDRWRALDEEHADGQSYETTERRRIGDEYFVLDSGSGAVVWDVVTVPPPAESLEEWVSYLEEARDEEYDPDESGERRVALAFFAHVIPIVYDPTQVERLVLQATEPVIEEELGDGAVRLGAQVAARPELVEAAGVPVAPMALALELDSDHRPRAARLEVAEGPLSLTLELAFTGWGTPVTVDPPADDHVERTPWLDEVGLDGVDPDLLLLPAEVPDGLELVSAEVDEEEGEDDMDCSSVDVEYATREALSAQMEDYEEPEGPSLELSVSPFECGYYEEDEFDGEVGGFPAAYVEDGGAVVRLGDLVVDITSTLDDDELDALVESLEQVTADELAARFPDWLPEVATARVD